MRPQSIEGKLTLAIFDAPRRLPHSAGKEHRDLELETRASDARCLKPETTVAELGAAGFTPVDAQPGDLPAAVTRLREEDGDSYWLTYRNFYVITRYNRSPLYAMAVFELSEAIRAGMTE